MAASAPVIGPLWRSRLSDANVVADRALLRLTLAGTGADGAFLDWVDAEYPVVETGDPAETSRPLGLVEFPDPPGEAFVLGATPGSERWVKWCESQGIGACVVIPIRDGEAAIGSIGLFGSRPGRPAASHVERLHLAGSVAASARGDRASVVGVQKVLDELRTILEPDLSGERILEGRLTYERLAKAVGRSLDATYCRIATRDPQGRLTIRASAGRRVPRSSRREWPLAIISEARRALESREPVALTFEELAPAGSAERRALFSSTTRTGVILPFSAGPSIDGVLLVGEERSTTRQPLLPELIVALEFVARRLGEILQLRTVLERGRLAEAQRQRRLVQVSERRRLSRELHDDVGQALSTLLMRIRLGITRGRLSTEDMELFEQVAQRALDASRAVAYRLRRPARHRDPIGDARHYSETTLESAGCTLTWRDDRTQRHLAPATAREVGRVIKESVTNIARHAEAHAVEIRLESSNGLLRVVIADNGVGFTPDEVIPISTGAGLGLLGNSERLAQVGGMFTVRSTPGSGTVVTIEAPR